MDLQTSLLISKARENSGSETIKRFDFQKDFSLKLIIDSYLSKGDFVVFLEFHDDILIMDSASNPSGLEFFQVKTKATNGNWKIKSLLATKAWKKSILWKMYLNNELFPKYTKKIFLVSNKNFDLKLKGWDNWADKTDISWNELSDAELDTINSNLKTELSLAVKPKFELIWNFHVTDLSLSDSQQHCVWKLSGLIDTISPGVPVNPQVAYRTIYDYIKKKSSTIFTEIEATKLKGDEFEKLVKLKWVSKNEFREILKAIGVWKDPEKIWLQIENDLKNSWVQILWLRPYKWWWQMYRSALVADSENSHVFKEIIVYLKDRLNDENFWNWLNLIQLCNLLYEEISLKFTSNIEVYEMDLIKGLILNEIYET